MDKAAMGIESMKARTWQEWIILLAAAWLLLSPFALGFAAINHPAAMLSWTCAVLLFASTSEMAPVPAAVEDWVDSGVGLGLLVAPWVLGFAGDAVAAMNTVATGLVIAVCAISALLRDLRQARG